MGVVADAFHQHRHRGLEVDEQIRRRQGFDDQVAKLAVGSIVSQTKHLHIVQSAGKDVSILADAAILDHRVLASTDRQIGASPVAAIGPVPMLQSEEQRKTKQLDKCKSLC
jgi:hypothetical protein